MCRRSTQANKYTQEELLLMKTQDVKYLDTKSRSEAAVSVQPAAAVNLLKHLMAVATEASLGSFAGHNLSSTGWPE
jgi:hypothetical protein